MTSPYSLFVGLLLCLPVPQPKVHYEQVMGEGQVLLDEGQHTSHCGAVTARLCCYKQVTLNSMDLQQRDEGNSSSTRVKGLSSLPDKLLI